MMLVAFFSVCTLNVWAVHVAVYSNTVEEVLWECVRMGRGWRVQDAVYICPETYMLYVYTIFYVLLGEYSCAHQ